VPNLPCLIALIVWFGLIGVIGNIVCYRRLPFTYSLLINDPDAIKRVLITNAKNYK
jgi:hypothetical protein